MGMLALTRRVGEEVVIGDPAKPLGIVRVVDIHGDKVRLAFDFPRDMQINRLELAEQKLREQQAAAQAGKAGTDANAPGNASEPASGPAPNHAPDPDPAESNAH